jgi:hypothetical protein
MKGKEIKELQNRLFFHLEPYFSSKGFQMDKKEWNMNGDHHTINLYVNTTHFDNYTLRPGVTILYKSLFDKIYNIVRTDDFQIFHNGNFDIYQKLANVFGIHDFDECIENNRNKFNISFTITVEYDNTIKVANRLIEFMESFGWKTIDSTSNLDKFYMFYKNLFLRYLDDVESNTDKNITQFVQGLDVNGYLTLIYLGLEKSDSQIYSIISRLEKWHNDDRSLYAKGARKIINHFEKLDK